MPDDRPEMTERRWAFGFRHWGGDMKVVQVQARSEGVARYKARRMLADDYGVQARTDKLIQMELANAE